LSDPTTQPSQTTPPTQAPAARQTFARPEIMKVLDHYPIGAVQSVREMIAGSSEAPKAVIECDRGKLLLKRRARGLEHGTMVGFAHDVILGCLAQGVCVPPLIGTKNDNNSMCQIGDRTYELFVFIDGGVFDQSVEHARQAGMLLGELHRAMDSIETEFDPTIESSVVNPDRSSGFGLPDATRDRVHKILEYGLDAHRANARPTAIVHGDWHPGNMIFDGSEIVAICDFDNCRIGSRDRELAQALVYLSMKRPTNDTVPSEASMEHLLAVWDGYLQKSDATPNPLLISALMPAVLLDEALAGGSASTRTTAIVDAAIQKAQWLDEHAPEISRAFDHR